MHRAVMPAAQGDPPARYAHAVLTESPGRWLHTSGVVPVRADGTVADSVAGQAATVWDTISTLLAEVDMGPADIISVTTYVVAGAAAAGLGQAMARRDAFLAGQLAASTLVTVPALAQPAWLIEIAVIAAS